MNAEIVKTFHFDAAHRLTNVPATHKCSRMHGHGYRVDIHIEGPIDPQAGWVMDFGDVAKTMDPILADLDHRLLNEVPNLPASTAEMLAVYIFNRAKPTLPGLSAVTVWESQTARCVYRGG